MARSLASHPLIRPALAALGALAVAAVLVAAKGPAARADLAPSPSPEIAAADRDAA
ncbi:MAG: hypothetical protein ACFBSD_06200 [Paracoccaceae bacterium]